MVQRVFIVRHGETDYNAQHRWQGQIDIPLNAMGMKQVAKLGEYFINTEIDAIFSSDLDRAYQTAYAVAQGKNLDIVKDARLREIALGEFEGLNRTEIAAKFPNELDGWTKDDNFAPPKGESRVQVQQRVLKVWQELVAYEAYETILIVSHGGTMRQLLKQIIPEQVEGVTFANTSISLLEKHHDEWYGRFVNQTPHLE